MRRVVWMIRRIVGQMIRGSTEDRLFQNASSLSFYTLLSIVPIFAIFFGIARGFGLDSLFEQEIYAGFENNPEIAEKLIQFSRSLLSQTQGGLITGIGIVTLLWTFIGMIGNFERALNDIWHVTEARSFFRRISDFLSIALLCPFYFILSSSLALFLGTEYSQISHHYPWLSQLSPFVLFLIRLIPILFSFLVFTFLYYYIPNTRVPFKSALAAGMIAGFVFYLVQWIYIKFQIGIANYSAVYGSFAALPLFLIWLQTSWLILLAGAELSYRITYRDHEPHPAAGLTTISPKELGVWTLREAHSHFKNGSYLSLKDAIKELHFNHPIIQNTWNTLIDKGILLEVKDENMGVVPGRPADSISLCDISDSLDDVCQSPINVPETEKILEIKKAFDSYELAAKELSANLKITDI